MDLKGTAAGSGQARCFAPRLTFTHAATLKFLEEALGSRWASIAYHLPRPPLEACVRVNTLKTTREEVMARLREELPGFEVLPDPCLKLAVFIRGSGARREAPIVYDDSVLQGREVIVGMMAGQSMLKGAELYAPGILASTRGLQPGDRVAVSIGLPIDPGKNQYGITRQAMLEPHTPLDDERFPHRGSLSIGVGEILLDRAQVTKPGGGGMAMVMREKLYDLPSLPNEFMAGLIMHQAFPSLLAACVLAPAPGSTVLDMCASPGGKTTAMAQLMENRGRIYAIDRTNKKVMKIEELARTMGIDIIVALKGDACSLFNSKKSTDNGLAVAANVEVKKSEKTLLHEERRRLNRIRHGHAPVDEQKRASVASGGFAAATFDHILLDAACSALGVRPRFLVDSTVDDLVKAAQYSRAMLVQAVHLLKPGGTLVFSTCTISPLENEGNVRFVLDTFPCMKLVEAGPGLHHGRMGLTGSITATEGKAPIQLLSEEEAKLVQRFDPDDGERSVLGFFICKMQKEGGQAM